MCGYPRLTHLLFCILFPMYFVRSTADGINIKNPFFHYPGGSDPYMGMILAIDLPLDLRRPTDLHFSLLYEAAYVLPTNETEFDYPPIIGNRKFLYNLIEEKIKSYGYSGKDCLLRAICEAAEYSSEQTGVIGDLVHVILTPSSSRSEGLKEHEDSEAYGKNNKHCIEYNNRCPFSILKLISRIENYLDKMLK